MREVPAPMGSETAWDMFCERSDIGHSDWKDNPGMVLQEIDKLLKVHDLQIVDHDAQDDTFHFSIERRW